MELTSGRYRWLILLFALVGTAGGCATSEFFKRLDAEHLQREHQTQLILLNYSPLKYYWEITHEGSTSRYEMRKGSYPGVPPVWQSTAEEELDSALLGYRSVPSVAPLTREIYHQTLERTLSSSTYLQLQPEFLILTDSTVRRPSAEDSLLWLEFPYDSIVGKPDWFLVLHVTDIGLMRTGIRTGSGLAGVLAAALGTALSEKQWCVWLSGTLLVVDAQTKKILWRDWLGFRQPVQEKLEELLNSGRQAFMRGLVVALSNAAAKHSADLLNNGWVDWNHPSVANFLLSKSEIDSITTRLAEISQ